MRKTGRSKRERELEIQIEVMRTEQRALLAGMSHEMRTPLNAIIGLAEMELGAETLGGDSFTNVEKIYRAGKALLDIINNFEEKFSPSFSVPRSRAGSQPLIRTDMSYAAVLVVDDVLTNLDVARGMLKPYKMRVDCVASGREAVDCIREAAIHYNAVFMDIMMPGMDGIEALRIIREEIDSEYARTIPIIALTANALPGNDSMLLRHGFQAFLAKPIDTLILDQILRQWVQDEKKEKTPPLVIPGIDVQTALIRFGNDTESYLRILASFAEHAPHFLENARTSTRDLQSFRIAVHSVKGSGRSVGADTIANMAEQLEHAALQGDTAFIETNTAIFIEAAYRLIATVNSALAGE